MGEGGAAGVHSLCPLTFANFYKFEDEFWIACMDCEITDKQVTEEGHVVTIVDNGHGKGGKRQVVYNPSNHVHIAHARCLNVKESHAVIYCVF